MLSGQLVSCQLHAPAPFMPGERQYILQEELGGYITNIHLIMSILQTTTQ